MALRGKAILLLPRPALRRNLLSRLRDPLSRLTGLYVLIFSTMVSELAAGTTHTPPALSTVIALAFVGRSLSGNRMRMPCAAGPLRGRAEDAAACGLACPAQTAAMTVAALRAAARFTKSRTRGRPVVRPRAYASSPMPGDALAKWSLVDPA